MKHFGTLLLLVLVILLGLGLISTEIELRKYQEQSTKIDNVNTDSIISVNDTLKIKIKVLDSVKNEKVIEVLNLGDDSTIKLFYELVSE